MAIFGPKPWVNPFGKISVFRLFELLVFTAEKGVFSIQNIVKDIFPDYIPFKKKRVGKMAIFGPKPWVNPFGKISVFRLFELLVFTAEKGVFSFQNIVKDIFPDYIPFKKKFEKWPFSDQNHGITPQGKHQFFDFLNFLSLKPRKAFIRSRIS